METLFSQYLLPTACSLSMFYALYWLLLRKHPALQLNRFYLLAGLLFSLLLPFITIYYTVPVYVEYTGLIENTPAAGIIQGEQPRHFLSVVTGGCFYLYVIGFACFIIHFFFSMGRIIALRWKYGAVKSDKCNVVYIQNKWPHCSFFHWIFINRNTLQEGDETVVLQHEKTHAVQGHSWDLLLMELTLAVQWFNPAVWAYKRALKMTHEYLADRVVSNTSSNKEDYLKLLFQEASGVSFNGLISNFNYSPIKKRIMMLTEKDIRHPRKSRVLWALPVVASLLLFFSFKAKEEIIVSNTNEPAVSGETRLQDTQPRFQGGDAATFGNWVQKNFKYPEEAAKKGVQGKVFVKFTVTATGELKDVQIARSIDPSIDKEVLRVVALSPKWEPGKENGQLKDVTLTLPIDLKIQEKTEKWVKVKDKPVKPVEEDKPVKPVEKEVTGISDKTPDLIPAALVEVKPVFQGGDENKFGDWVKSNFIYPEEASKKGVQGKVHVQYVVSEKGEVTDIKIVRSLDPSIDKELLRVMATSPKWEPGKMKGKPVSVKYTLPINLKLK